MTTPACPGRSTRSRHRGDSAHERGSGSVLVLAAVAVVAVVLAGCLTVVAAVRDVHRARSAADLGALAAARHSAHGAGADCAAAGAVGAAVGAALGECRELSDGSVLVVMTVPARWPAGWPGLPGRVEGAARAGPVLVPP